MSNMPESVLEKIREAKEKQLKELDLSTIFTGADETRMPFIPPEVFELTRFSASSCPFSKPRFSRF